MTIPGFTSTGSKRPDVLFGSATGMPRSMTRAEGCRLWDGAGTEYVDMMMALGAVALGYAHPAVVTATSEAVRAGTVGSLPPTLELDVAERLTAAIPGAEGVRFFKSGAEAVAAAVRVARVYTDRERVVTCGYHGWLDWCQSEPGVPRSVAALRTEIPFNDVDALERAMERAAPVAALVLEPVIDAAPEIEWLQAARAVADRTGAVLIFDEIKTAFRLALGGVAQRYGVVPDLIVLGKAMGNGFPVAALCGCKDVMHAATRTWISSTLATEFASLAAVRAVLDVFDGEAVVEHLEKVGAVLFGGLERIAERYPGVFARVRGIPQMCYLHCTDSTSWESVAAGMARRGILCKFAAYNFVSLAHSDQVVERVLQQLDRVAGQVEAAC
ncbi:MAG: aminotransferase class III-fold pyridoxal phosphate-dependent enzyme [Gemmatimonadota bacterium]|nr:MAG: aminotransferase class III-fold pyridoxal phosphate-dependent enzyme [Gemmatimonadota bacterium]